jgi:hypothetical protein
VPAKVKNIFVPHLKLLHMNNTPLLKKYTLFACLFIGPLFQLVGDALWLTGNYNYSWNIWREASYIFFIPAGFLLAKILEKKSFTWAMIACALFVIGCIGSATMMPLFRLGGFYPIQGQYQFPVIVQSVLDKKLFAVTLFPAGLCFPVSFIVFGAGYLKHKLINIPFGLVMMLCGILFFLGNAGEMEALLLAGDTLILFTLVYFGYHLYLKEQNFVAQDKNYPVTLSN